MKKNMKGITLISLVVTIIVMLILASVTMNLTLGDNGIITKAKESRNKMERAMLLERIQTEILENQLTRGETKIYKDDLETILSNHGNPQYDEAGSIIGLKPEGKEEIILIEDIIGNTQIIQGVKVGDLFDETGTVEGKLHVGDFIDYSAGIWEEKDMTTISETTGIKPSTGKPSGNYQFGGFEVGESRDGNAIPSDKNYAYIEDKATETAITGWRLFDVNDGVMTLISAGCPEDYYKAAGTNSAYISAYILTGNESLKTEYPNLGLGTTYKARNWDMYANRNYGATGATFLGSREIDSWFRKYIDGNPAGPYALDVFRKIYRTSSDCVGKGIYESIIDNNSFFWLSDTYGDNYSHIFTPNSKTGGIQVSECRDSGIRVLVYISPEVKVLNEAIGTKTVISKDYEYTYNVWNLITE